MLMRRYAALLLQLLRLRLTGERLVVLFTVSARVLWLKPRDRSMQEETRSMEDAGPEGVERRAAQVHQARLIGVSWLRHGHVIRRHAAEVTVLRY